MTIGIPHGGAPYPTPGIDRRTFLQALAVLVAGGALVGLERSPQLTASTARPGGTLAAPVPALRRSLFSGRLADTFWIESDGSNRVAATLTRVRDLHSQAALGRHVPAEQLAEQCFSLVLRTVGSPRLQQDVYGLHNAALGQLTLLLVPMISDGDAHFYEAVINSYGR